MATSQYFADAEVPGGTIDGVNIVFTLAHLPSPAASLSLYRNGVFNKQGTDYTLLNQIITFSPGFAPQVGDTILAFYTYVGLVIDVDQQYVDNEIPAGNIDGTNTVFTIDLLPNPAASLRVFRNGLLTQSGSDYTLVSQTITFISAPQIGDNLKAFYRLEQTFTPTPTVVSFIENEVPTGLINDSNRIFTLSQIPSPPASLLLYYNGLSLTPGADYTLSGNTITMLYAPFSGSVFTAFYRYFSTIEFNRFTVQTKIDFLPYIRRYLNDANGYIWDDSSLSTYMNEGEVDVTYRLMTFWARFAINIQNNVNLYMMPTNLKAVTRVTYRGFKCDALTQKQLSVLSPVYRTQNSLPRWWSLQFEGYYNLRLYPGPSENLPILDVGNEVYTDKNLLNECIVSGYFYAIESTPYFTVPDYMYRLLVRYYVLWKSFLQEGKGQNTVLGKYYMQKYEAQVAQGQKYLAKIHSSKERQYTDVAIQRPWQKHRPILPPNFGVQIGPYW